LNDKLMEQSCRVALAAYLHDLGKFAERAGAFDMDPRLDPHLQLYCPWNERPEKRGYFSHRHAAHTALAFDVIERHLPDLLGTSQGDASPFVGRRFADTEPEYDVEATDSLINASAAHHKPDTFLQWIVATADRLTSGFEREEFDRYNQEKDEDRKGLDHFSSRLLTLFEQVRLDSSQPSNVLSKRYPLKALSCSALFPVSAHQCELPNRDRAKSEYTTLWDGFVRSLERIPSSHRSNWALWLDHFDSLWLAFTHAIPSATAFNVRPEVSLYDHSRTVAALAVALWRWHSDRGRTDEAAVRMLRERNDYDEWKFLLIQGDFFGIQQFLFASGGDTRRNAAKLLRGRSAQVALFTELAALRLLDELALPPTSQVLNAAGKFLIVAPNTEGVRTRLHDLRAEFDKWFLGHTFGLAGIGLAWEEACCRDFLKRQQGRSTPYSQLLDRLRRSLEMAKHRRFDLCGNPPAAFAQRFPHRVCEYNGWLPADRPGDGQDPASCALSRDQIKIGESLPRFDRLLVLREDGANQLRISGNLNKLELDLFGYALSFTADQDASGAFGGLARSRAMRRCWDLSPASDDTGLELLWSGYARRSVSGYVPRANAQVIKAERSRYSAIDDAELSPHDAPKTLDMIACEDRRRNAEENWIGVSALGVVKGDVDDLGEIFRVGLQSPTFAKTAALSRQLNGFFTIYLPWLLAREFPNTYTVFAGGDDFFLICPWQSAQNLAARMRKEFGRYVAENMQIHFSAGIATQKPGAPIAALADLADDALERAKKSPGKNAVTCFNETVQWSEWPAIMRALEELRNLGDEQQLSSGYVYRLLRFVEMSGREMRGSAQDAIWRSQFKYATQRYIVDKQRGLSESEQQQLFSQVAQQIGGAIAQLQSRYRIVLFNHIYAMRAG
jgi:CRISPR-associated protein Csm1